MRLHVLYAHIGKCVYLGIVTPKTEPQLGTMDICVVVLLLISEPLYPVSPINNLPRSILVDGSCLMFLYVTMNFR